MAGDENKMVPQKTTNFTFAMDMLRDNGYSYVGTFTGAGTPIIEYKRPDSEQTIGIQKSGDGVVVIPDFGNKKATMASGTPAVGFRVEQTPDSSFKDEFVRLMANRRRPLPSEPAMAEAPAKKKAILQ